VNEALSQKGVQASCRVGGRGATPGTGRLVRPMCVGGIDVLGTAVTVSIQLYHVYHACNATYHSDEHELVQLVTASVGHSAIGECECTDKMVCSRGCESTDRVASKATRSHNTKGGIQRMRTRPTASTPVCALTNTLIYAHLSTTTLVVWPMVMRR
jgi:hypothetical protein